MGRLMGSVQMAQSGMLMYAGNVVCGKGISFGLVQAMSELMLMKVDLVTCSNHSIGEHV